MFREYSRISVESCRLPAVPRCKPTNLVRKLCRFKFRRKCVYDPILRNYLFFNHTPVSSQRLRCPVHSPRQRQWIDNDRTPVVRCAVDLRQFRLVNGVQERTSIRGGQLSGTRSSANRFQALCRFANWSIPFRRRPSKRLTKRNSSRAPTTFPRPSPNSKKQSRSTPQYRDAHLNLGVQYARVGRTADARAEFQKALDIGPPAAPIYADLALTSLALRSTARPRHSPAKPWNWIRRTVAPNAPSNTRSKPLILTANFRWCLPVSDC